MKLRIRPKKPKKLPKFTELGGFDAKQHLKDVQQYYFDIYKVGKLFRKKELYQRPWFMMMGTQGSGKSNLLMSVEQYFPYSFPSGADEYEAQSAQALSWKFGDDCVWAELPGQILEDGFKKDFLSVVKAFGDNRNQMPMDAIVTTVNLEALLGAKDTQIKDMAQSIRQNINIIIRTWGYEVPVFLLFTHTDKINGFNILFSDPKGNWDEQLLGRVISDPNCESPKDLFLEEFDALVDHLKIIQTKMLVREKGLTPRCAINEFMIQFAGLRSKLSTFVSDFYRKNRREGQPGFAGFFFTSCQEDSRQQIAQPQNDMLGNTIVGHPLNPNKSSDFFQIDAPEKRKLKCLFTTTLLTDILPKYPATHLKTPRKTQKDKVSLYMRTIFGLVFAVFAIWMCWALSNRVKTSDAQVVADINKFNRHAPDRYETLHKIQSHYIRLKKHAKSGRPFSRKLLMHPSTELFTSVRKAYFSALYGAVIQPCSLAAVQYLQRTLPLSNNHPDVDFFKMKSSLHAYIALSNASKMYEDVAYGGVLASAIQYNLKERFYKDKPFDKATKKHMESVLNKYVSLLEKREIPLIRSQGTLVRETQRKLVQLFDADAVYETVLARNMSKHYKKLDVSDIVNEEGEYRYVAAEKLSELFTPEGWTKVIRPSFLQESGRLDNIESWVTGMYKASLPKHLTNPQKLHAELVRSYLFDTQNAWQLFLSSLSLKPFEDIESLRNWMLNLSGKNSELQKLVSKFGEWSLAISGSDSTESLRPIVEQFQKSMAFFQKPIDGYQEKLNAIAKGLESALEKGKYADVFTGRPMEDPLCGAYAFTKDFLQKDYRCNERVTRNNECQYLERAMLMPLEFTNKMLTTPIKKEINDLWQSEVFYPFKDKMSGAYPFEEPGNGASSQEEVIAFFKPEEGRFWKVFNTYLSPYLDAQDNYKRKVLQGQIDLKFSGNGLRCIKHADKITKVFFDKQNEPRLWEIELAPLDRRLQSASIRVGDTNIDILKKGLGRFSWPHDKKEATGVHLVFTDHHNNTLQNIFKGPWGFMMMMNQTKKDQRYFSFTRQFTAYLHAKTIAINKYQKVRVTVSDKMHPFCSNPVKGFTVPRMLM